MKLNLKSFCPKYLYFLHGKLPHSFKLFFLISLLTFYTSAILGHQNHVVDAVGIIREKNEQNSRNIAQSHVGYVVQIRRDDKKHLPNSYLLCGATLITNRHLLTAAQCFNPSDRGRFVFAAIFNASSVHSINVTQTLHQTFTYAKNVRLHPHYCHHRNFPPRRALQNDIAIVKLDEPVQLGDGIETVCLAEDQTCRNNNLIGEELTAYGWGRTDCLVHSFHLLSLQGKFQDWRNCRGTKNSKYYHNVNDHHICVKYDRLGNSNRKFTTDEGDYGGPLILKSKSNDTTDVQVGILSGNDLRYIYIQQESGVIGSPSGANWYLWGCADAGKPTVTTNIGKYKRWIQRMAPGARFC